MRNHVGSVQKKCFNGHKHCSQLPVLDVTVRCFLPLMRPFYRVLFEKKKNFPFDPKNNCVNNHPFHHLNERHEEKRRGGFAHRNTSQSVDKQSEAGEQLRHNKHHQPCDARLRAVWTRRRTDSRPDNCH